MKATCSLLFLLGDWLSVFSVLDSAAGTVTGYVANVIDLDAPASAFDRITLGAR